MGICCCLDDCDWPLSVIHREHIPQHENCQHVTTSLWYRQNLRVSPSADSLGGYQLFGCNPAFLQISEIDSRPVIASIGISNFVGGVICYAWYILTSWTSRTGDRRYVFTNSIKLLGQSLSRATQSWSTMTLNTIKSSSSKSLWAWSIPLAGMNSQTSYLWQLKAIFQADW